jgi:uncharacterized glyoxalase superfamily protein PhnB
MFDKPAQLAIVANVIYADPDAAVAWLERAFGFEPRVIIRDAEGVMHYSELYCGDGHIHVGREWDARTKSPRSLGGAFTMTLGVSLPGDLDAHCERARAAGAVIEREPADQFYGDRSYCALDLEGHFWSFSTKISDVPLADLARQRGLAVEQR